MLGVDVEFDEIVVVHEHRAVPSPFDELMQSAGLAFALVFRALFHDALGAVRIGDLRLRQSRSGGRLAAGHGVLLRCGDEIALEHLVHGVEDAQEAVAARVYHACLFQLGQLFRGLVQGGIGGGDNGHEQGLKILIRGELHQLSGTLGSRPHDGQDGALGGVHDRLISALDAGVHGLGKVRDGGGLLLLQGTGDTAEEDGEDDAGVAAGTAEHILCHATGASAQGHSGVELEVIDPTHGHGHIGTGIPIGHRKHVHIVDGLAVGGQQIGSAAQHLIISFSR